MGILSVVAADSALDTSAVDAGADAGTGGATCLWAAAEPVALD